MSTRRKAAPATISMKTGSREAKTADIAQERLERRRPA